jgi:RimJ/RimL family protein N-acetyltransferase
VRTRRISYAAPREPHPRGPHPRGPHPRGPLLETPRLLLRPWREDDVADYVRIIGDPEVMRHMGSGLGYRMKRAAGSFLGLVTAFEARRRIAHLIEHWNTWGYGEWAVEEKASAALVGQVGLVRLADWLADPAQVEVGWMLAHRAWGRGFATEAARASLAYAFEELGMARIVSITRPANRRSERVMARIGLSFGGRINWKGAEVIWYVIDRATWERTRLGMSDSTASSARGTGC